MNNNELGNKILENLDPNTIIDKGFVISPNFLIEHVTEGAIHNAIGRVIPMFTQQLNLDVLSQAQMFDTVKNLIVNVSSVLDPVFAELGSGTIVRQAFNLNPDAIYSNDESSHMSGVSLDIAVAGEEHNMYHVAQEIRRIAKRATSMSVIYDTQSWIHIDSSNRQRAFLPDHWLSAEELPIINSIDNLSKELQIGNVPIRGLF